MSKIPPHALNANVSIDVIGGICATCFLLGLSMVQDSGSYVVQLFDKFSANISLLVIAICEFISVTWFYGINRYAWIGYYVLSGIYINAYTLCNHNFIL